jgi:hypothetical protein
MTDINKTIIELIRQNKGMKEISSILNISEKQLYIRIKQIINYGYQILPSYSYDSDIYYKIFNKQVSTKESELSIKMNDSSKQFRCLVISDQHIGNIASNMEFLNIIYEYAAKNGINVILSCGDMLEGTHSSDRKNIRDIYEQIETFIKQYPYDKNIMNFGILGNHDYHFIHFDGIDIRKRIMSARYDIVLFGYGNGLLKIKNDFILLTHNLSVTKNKTFEKAPKITLSGHGHMMKSKFYDDLILCIPTLSNVSPDKTKEVIPGFVDMTIQLNKGKFEYLEAHHMIIAPKVYEASQTRCRVKSLTNEKIDNNKGKN